MVTVNDLLSSGAPADFIAWMRAHYKNEEATIEDLMLNADIDFEFLQFLKTHKDYKDCHKEMMNNALNIKCEHHTLVYQSHDVYDSGVVSYSCYVENSDYVFHSQDVRHSNNIAGSTEVDDSQLIFNSNYIICSNNVLRGTNIDHSDNIVDSSFVRHSSYVKHSSAIRDSAYIFDNSRDINSSFFIRAGAHLTNCLFCDNIENGEYMVFNQKVSESDYDYIRATMHRLLKNWQPKIFVELKRNEIPLAIPQLYYDKAILKDLPETFWKWVVSLPTYDANIMLDITNDIRSYSYWLQYNKEQ